VGTGVGGGVDAVFVVGIEEIDVPDLKEK